jgi:hypothetical protein
MYGRLSLCVVVSTAAAFAAAVNPRADQIPAGWYASNMKPIGYSALDGRGGAFKMSIKRSGDRWYLYVAQLWTPGWTILDVTEPANPTVANFIKGPDNTAAVQIDLHDNVMITGLQAAPPGWGGDSKKPHEEGAMLWDVRDPVHPKQLSHWKTGAGGTHRNGYPGGHYANLAASLPGFRGLSLAFLDISDPTNPWLAGHLLQHNPDVEKQADLIYLSYFTAGLRIFDIKDSHVPKEVGWFLPPTPTKRYGPVPADRLQSSTEDVLVDTRGNIYITDKQWGVFILRYTGKEEPVSTTR